ncbi:hypothetical protein PVA17_20270 [Lysinibacillus sp. CNPSo 3705]|uniref:hypothetical protein n=1 Tax=Lysinibacillus sp. CNPSo 3705 TaxID=3028148 RepID=UPI002364032F|nr:hypothetical protein [Lysinibacillus sp. CNPSo 3705]MDD1505081.1 hypothetical protein [Lysinibacillus sp. CNPSo 3705]
MKSLELLALMEEQQNLIKSISFLENEYSDINKQIKSILLKELEVCQNQISSWKRQK